MSNGERKNIPMWARFGIGGSAGMAATLIVQPFDLVKNRMQLSGEGGTARTSKTLPGTLMSVIRNEGVFSLYTGLSAGLFRQATYTTTRMGVYTSLRVHFTKDGGQSSFGQDLMFGACAGGIGSIVGTPAEICLVRMTADGRLPVDQRRNYKHVFNALARICKEEGVLAMWRGCTPTVVRAIAVNMAQLPSYTETKKQLIRRFDWGDDLRTRIVASMISSFVTTFVSIPIDITKTRIQNMKYIDGKPEYTGIIDVFKKTISKEGFFSLWKGFMPYWLRLGPHTIFTFIFMEQMNSYYRKNILKDMSGSGGL